jgi:hypothetical protein
MKPACGSKAMVDSERQIECLTYVVRKTRLEAQRVALRLIATSLIPSSNAHITLKARHTALVKLADEGQAEIERLRRADTADPEAGQLRALARWRDAPRSTLEAG